MKALLIVDVQNDFLPGGALAVTDGDQIIPVINKIKSEFPLVVASKDWHPRGHHSFAQTHDMKVGDIINLHGASQILWPVHCVQDTEGARFPMELEREGIDHVVLKGTDEEIDSYSAFYDNAKERSTGLNQFLRENEVEELYVAGLATDYCVKYTVLDALHEGYEVYLVEDACRGVDLNPGDSDKAIKEMKQAGAKVIRSEELL